MNFAGTTYRVGNRFIGQTAGVRIVVDTVQITVDAALVRTPSPSLNRAGSCRGSMKPGAVQTSSSPPQTWPIPRRWFEVGRGRSSAAPSAEERQSAC